MTYMACTGFRHIYLFFSEMVASYFYLTPDVVLVVSLVVTNPKFVKKNAVCKIAVFTVGYLKKKDINRDLV